jgi:hypothetical protein
MERVAVYTAKHKERKKKQEEKEVNNFSEKVHLLMISQSITFSSIRH